MCSKKAICPVKWKAWPLLVWGALIMAGGGSFACAPGYNYLDPEGPQYSGRYAAPPGAFNDTVTVVSFNIQWAKNIALAIEELSTIDALRDADILLLQEMDEVGTEAIARARACDYVYYPATLHPQNKKKFGNAILARWPIREARKILLPYAVMGNRTRRIAVSAVVEVAGFEILTYTVHTATFVQGEEKKYRQAEAVLKSVPPQFQRVLIGGDFNTLTRESWYAHGFLFRKNGFTLASSPVQPTGGRWLFQATLDHIFVRGLRPIAAGVVAGSRASDHRPIWVKLVMT